MKPHDSPSAPARWGVRAKLFACTVIATLGVMTLAGFNLYSGYANSAALESVYESNVRSLVQLRKLDGMILDLRLRAAGMLLGQVQPQDALKHLQDHRRRLDLVWTGLIGLVDTMNAEQRALMADMARGWGFVSRTLDRLEGAYTAKDPKQLLAVLDADWPEVHTGFTLPLEKLMPLKEQEAKSIYEDAAAANALLNQASLVLAVVMTVLMGALLFFISRSVRRQLGGEPDYAAGIVRNIADGDLTTDIELEAHDHDSLLHGMKRMQEQLRQTAALMQQSAALVAGASIQISSGNAELSRRTEGQASSLEETSSSMEELLGAVKRNAESAGRGNELAASASTVATKGGKVVGEVVQTMSSIHDSSKRISDIVGVIDAIAFQTNLLALNAAVEAARAGEQGRSFAVVASEVRSLAHRTAEAAREIKGLISDSVSRVESGSQLADEAGRTMQEIVASVQRVTAVMAEVTAASQEQRLGIEQVNQAMTQMEDTTQRNAALAEQAAAAAQSLQEQARTLTDAVCVFRLERRVAERPSPGVAALLDARAAA